MWDLGFVCLCANQRQRGKCILVLHLCISRREKWKAFSQTDPLLCPWRLAMAGPTTRFMSGAMRIVTPQPAAAVQGSLGLHFLFWWWARLLYGRVSAQSLMLHAYTHMCISTYITIYTYVHIPVHTYTCMHAHSCTHIYLRLSPCTYMHTNTHVICICMSYTCTCIHICSLALSFSPSPSSPLSVRFSQAGGSSLDNGWLLLPGPVIVANSAVAQVISTKWFSTGIFKLTMERSVSFRSNTSASSWSHSWVSLVTVSSSSWFCSKLMVCQLERALESYPSIGTSLLGILAISGSPCSPYIVHFWDNVSMCCPGWSWTCDLPASDWVHHHAQLLHRSYNPSLSFFTYIMELYS